MKNINNYFLSILFTLLSIGIGYGQCGSVNAGGSSTTCGTEYTLAGSTEGDATGLMWSVVSVPTGATDPTISDPTILNPLITGMNKPGYYKFRLTKTCAGGSTTFSEVTITSTGDTSTFSAGSDITDVFATVGTVNLNGVIPEGFTGEWRAENIYFKERLGQINSANSQFDDKNSASTTFSLIKKADHDVDPAYRLFLKITSIYNPNCTMTKSVVVRFVPNPVIDLRLDYAECSPVLENDLKYIFFNSGSPEFDTRTNFTSGNPAYGTSVTLNVVSQPNGGNMEFLGFGDGTLGFIKLNAIGVYKFKLTIENAAGSYTTPEITYNKTGVAPSRPNFIFPEYPNQKTVYGPSGSAGSVYCDYNGTTTPITVYYSLGDNDPTSLVSEISFTSEIPTGGAPSVTMNGAGQKDRNVVLQPPTGGWNVGTYLMNVKLSSENCYSSENFYIHISDGAREDINFDDIVVCYPGSGSVDAEVKLPPVFKGVPDLSYLQDYTGVYTFSVISQPEGSSEPEFGVDSQRLFTLESMMINNLDKSGIYEFKVVLEGRVPSTRWVLEEEYACSGASRETTFKIIVSEQVGSNAGSNQPDVFCRERIVLVGNDPGVGTGEWTVESAPLGTNISFSDVASPRAVVAGLDQTGIYQFRWTITTGGCESSSIVEVVTNQDNCKSPFLITNPMMPGKTKKRAK
ncbi:hypothetical protein VSO92_14150 [Myroides pelagicus]|uniref:hypothetical protein n=1 Tax=Myroides pelagicus TaxID=270914 RepID=UPI002DB8DF74|nr:hypothetical protein [Myroides pelagicus]MEC4115242.1 hypothetical protein [Myroides pelagicus]